MLRSLALVAVFALALAPSATARAQSAPLRAGDRLVVVLADTADTVAVRADGSAVLPRLGSLALAGLDLGAAEDSVARAYRSVVARRDVRVTALRRVVVTGEVPRGDLFFVDATVGLAEALALAGGVGPEGNRKRVELWRDGALVGRFDARSGAALRAPLHSGDIVLVARANWWSRNPFVIVSLLSSAVSLIIALSL
jgi:protein involved in polysaccharide export with SLBB domain